MRKLRKAYEVDPVRCHYPLGVLTPDSCMDGL